MENADDRVAECPGFGVLDLCDCVAAPQLGELWRRRLEPGDDKTRPGPYAVHTIGSERRTRMTPSTPEPGGRAPQSLLTRRNLIASTGLAAAAMSAAPLLGRSTARASAFAVPADCPPGTTAPVPPAAKGPAIPAAGYLVEEIADRVYWLTDGLYQMIFVATADGVVAVDAPPTIGNNILRAIATVERGLNVQAGEDVLNLAYHGPNHSPGNIFINLPAQRVLMLVDVVFPGWVPFAYLAESQNIPGWLEAPAVALNYPFDTYVGGHLTRLGTRNDVIIQQEYVTELKTQAANAIATFNPETVYQTVDPTNPWAIFRGYLDGVAAQAASAVVPNWIGRLGGADVYTLANAYQMVESLRIDCGQLGPFGIHP